MKSDYCVLIALKYDLNTDQRKNKKQNDKTPMPHVLERDAVEWK